MKQLKIILPLLMGLILSLSIQKANATEHSDSIPKIKLHYTTSLNGSFTRNKIEHLVLSTNNALTLQRGVFGFTQALNYQYSLLRSPLTAPRINLLNELQVNSKFSINLGKLEPLFIIGYEKSRFRSIDNRKFAIVGADYKLINSNQNHFSILLGPSAESSLYLDGLNYKNLFFCVGLRGLHELNKNKSKFKLMYNTYFFRRYNENNWRYQGIATAMFQVLKPLYASVNMNFSEEKIISSDAFRKNTTITFGMTYKM